MLGAVSRCSFCKQTSSVKFKVCGKCKNVYYCSRRCQRENWTYHKQRCGKKLKKDSRVTVRDGNLSVLLTNHNTEALHCACCGGLDFLKKTREGVLCEQCIDSIFL